MWSVCLYTSHASIIVAKCFPAHFTRSITPRRFMQVEIVVIGCGLKTQQPSPSLLSYLKQNNIAYEILGAKHFPYFVLLVSMSF